MTTHRGILGTGRILAVLGLLSTILMPFVGTASATHCHDECDRSYGRIAGMRAGSVNLDTAFGTHRIDVARGGDYGFAISTTGEVTVEVEYRCLEAYHLYVVKSGERNGLPSLGWTVVYDEWRYPGCGSGVDVHNVPIGLDAGEYEFILEWWGCTGESGTDYRQMVIFDPPLPLVGA